MTRSQGQVLSLKVQDLEAEVAKLQRVRHDMEILLVKQIGNLIDRIGKIERQLSAFRESLSDDSLQKNDLITEVKRLRGELEEAQYRHQALLKNQISLFESQKAIKEAQKKIQVPPFKDDHFSLAKKYFLNNDHKKAIFLLQEFIKSYPDSKEMVAQSYYLLGEIFRKKGELAKSKEESDIDFKKAVVSYQKIIDMYKNSPLREEALYKMGLVLKNMGNIAGSRLAFKELLSKHSKSKRAPEAKRHLSTLAVSDKP